MPEEEDKDIVDIEGEGKHGIGNKGISSESCFMPGMDWAGSGDEKEDKEEEEREEGSCNVVRGTDSRSRLSTGLMSSVFGEMASSVQALPSFCPEREGKHRGSEDWEIAKFAAVEGEIEGEGQEEERQVEGR